MSKLEEKIESLGTMLSDINDQDISHDELGVANGFHEAQEAKDESCSYLSAIVDRLRQYSDKLNSVIVDEKITQIEQWLAQADKYAEQVDNLAGSGVHEANFPKQRTNLLDAIRKQKESLKKNLYSLELDLKLCEVSEKLEDQEFFNEARSNAADYIEKAEDAASKVEKVLDAVQQKTINTQVGESAAQFGDLVDHHKDYERNWFIAVVVSAILLCVAVFYAVWWMPDTLSEGQSSFEFLVGFLKKIVLISIAGVFVRVSLAKYNTERGLRIVYGHRQKVLDQYLSFEAGIGDDMEAKNQFRLEIAKYIFSDPQSNYSSQVNNPGSEININPIISAAESITRAK
ncbi:hypothetical protein MRB56_12760 [Halomonas cupida]|uniref:hypothetical protein n=1 Tax=Halomonas cupida TaxID=44933 RepID=UPI0039B3C73B